MKCYLDKKVKCKEPCQFWESNECQGRRSVNYLCWYVGCVLMAFGAMALAFHWVGCTTRTYTVYMFGDSPRVSVGVDKTETISPEVKASLK